MVALPPKFKLIPVCQIPYIGRARPCRALSATTTNNMDESLRGHVEIGLGAKLRWNRGA